MIPEYIKPEKPEDEQKRLAAEADEILLESLVKSPAFHALLRLLRLERDKRYAKFLITTDPTEFYQIQGEIRGMNLTENLPGLIVQRREQRFKHEEEKKRFKPRIRMPGKQESPEIGPKKPQSPLKPPV